jgi:glutamyl-tRNA synthetase
MASGFEKFKDVAKAYALKNALSHNGKATQGAVIAGLFNVGLKREDVGKYSKDIQKIIDEVNSMAPTDQVMDYEELKEFVGARPERDGLPELPNVGKKGVVMRFRPAPSGPLHLGHIISNLASSLYVKNYGGKFYVIIDDTDPSTTIKTAYDNLKKDCDWIFGNVSEYINASDRMRLYYRYIERLLQKDAAYVCSCNPEDFREKHVKLKKDCPCRNLGIKEQLSRWEKMIDKDGYMEGNVVLRFKTPDTHKGMMHKNPAMRDFPLARISEKEHPLQKNKYRVWPLMNLAVAVDDIELGMTHIIRGKDHRDNAERQKMIYEVLGIVKDYPWNFFIGRIKFSDLVLSKREISKRIELGEFSGEDDEKLPTVSSLRKRNYKPLAFEKFIEQRGLTEVDKVISGKDLFDVIDRLNKSD